MAIFKSFRSTVAPFLSRSIPNNLKLLVDSTTGAPAGIENWNANGADGIFVPIDLTAAQIAAPTALMIADLNAVYRLNVAPYPRYRSDGTTLVEAAGNSQFSVLSELALAAGSNNPQTNPPMGTPPVITESAIVSATLTNTVDWNDSDASVFNFYGGQITSQLGGTFASFVSTTVTGSLVPFVFRVETVVDAVKVQFRLFNIGSKLIRFIVDGQFVSFTPLTLGVLGITYVTLDFTSAGGRAARTIAVEGINGVNFGGVSVLPTEGLARPGGIVKRASFIGGSYIASGGITYTPAGCANVLSDLLGIRDVWQDGIGGTGFINNGTTQTSYIQRISDIVLANPDILFIEGGRNDGLSSSAVITAAVIAYVTAIRAQVSQKIPIIILGTFVGGGVTLATAQTIETAIQAAVTTLADPAIYLLLDANNPAGAYFVGTGSTAAPTGVGNCDVYISSDNVHPNIAGHAFLANRIADDVRRAVFQISPAANAVSDPAPPGFGVQGASGLFGTQIVWSPLIVDTMPGLEVRGTISVQNLPA